MQEPKGPFKTTNVIDDQKGDNKLTKKDCTRTYKTLKKRVISYLA